MCGSCALCHVSDEAHFSPYVWCIFPWKYELIRHMPHFSPYVYICCVFGETEIREMSHVSYELIFPWKYASHIWRDMSLIRHMYGEKWAYFHGIWAHKTHDSFLISMEYELIRHMTHFSPYVWCIFPFGKTEICITHMWCHTYAMVKWKYTSQKWAS